MLVLDLVEMFTDGRLVNDAVRNSSQMNHEVFRTVRGRDDLEAGRDHFFDREWGAIFMLSIHDLLVVDIQELKEVDDEVTEQVDY